MRLVFVAVALVAAVTLGVAATGTDYTWEPAVLKGEKGRAVRTLIRAYVYQVSEPAGPVQIMGRAREDPTVFLVVGGELWHVLDLNADFTAVDAEVVTPAPLRTVAGETRDRPTDRETLLDAARDDGLAPARDHRQYGVPEGAPDV